jgi:hypothetical protein
MSIMIQLQRFTFGLVGLASLALVACGDDGTCSTQCGSGGSGGSTTTSANGGGGNGTGAAGGGTSQVGGGGTGGAGGGIPSEWIVPTCTTITGTAAVTFTKDEGATLTPSNQTLSGVGYTGLAALDTPNTLLAEHKGDLLRSTDAGCTWNKIGTLEGGLFELTAASGGRAYAWVDNGEAFYRIDDGVPTPLTTPAPNIVGLGVDPADGLHLRIGDASGAVSDSTDGGVTWNKQGDPATTGGLTIGYRFAFDPTDLDHYLFGQSTDGASVTFDGGTTWMKSTGIGAANANAFSIAVSPANPDVVWVEAIELGPDQRHIYRSTDGGLTFTSVVDSSADVTLINGNLLSPHPTNEDVLYFVFGTSFQGYGTDLYRYDQSTGQVTKTHNQNHGITEIVASPADDTVQYLGLVVEQIN